MWQIKFRGKRIDNGKWMYGSYLYLNTHDYDATGTASNAKKVVHFIIDEEDMNIAVDPETICQFTGFHDDGDEGEELFNGDIVELEYSNEKHICKIEFEGCGFMFVSDSFPDGFIWVSEIIECDRNYWWVEGTKLLGNKYENPKLLELARSAIETTAIPKPKDKVKSII